MRLQALETIRAHSPLIELGAGLGHWQRELSQRGANVLAYDNMSSLPLPDVRIAKPEFVGAVSGTACASVLERVHAPPLLVV